MAPPADPPKPVVVVPKPADPPKPAAPPPAKPADPAKKPDDKKPAEKAAEKPADKPATEKATDKPPHDERKYPFPPDTSETYCLQWEMTQRALDKTDDGAHKHWWDKMKEK